MVDRSDSGSWMSGPGPAREGNGGLSAYRGERLGLPESGAGSVAGFGRRLAALAIDWLVALLAVAMASRLGLVAAQYGSNDFGFLVLAVFFVEATALTWLLSASFGQRALGIGPVLASGGPLGLVRSALRTALLCIVIPAVVIDRDGRGLHDRAVGSVVVCRR